MFQYTVLALHSPGPSCPAAQWKPDQSLGTYIVDLKKEQSRRMNHLFSGNFKIRLGIPSLLIQL